MNTAICNSKKLSIFYHGNRTWCLNSPGHYDPYPGHKADTVSTFWISILHSSTLDYWKIQDKTNNKIFNFVPLLIFPWKAQSVLYKKIGSTLKLLDLSSYYILTLIETPESFLISPLHRAAVLLEYSENYTIMPSLNGKWRYSQITTLFSLTIIYHFQVISWLQCLWCSSYPSSTEDRTRRFASLFSQQHRWQTYPPQCPSTAATLLWPVWPSCQSSTQSSTQSSSTPSYLSQVKTRYSLLMSAQCNSHVWVFLINSGSSFIKLAARELSKLGLIKRRNYFTFYILWKHL